MKKSLLALAVLGAFAGVAQAQTSVTVYGSFDGGLRYVRNATAAGENKLSVSNNGTYNSNRLGFKGVEDLGGGMNARFNLETGFNTGNGQVESVTGSGFGSTGSSGAAPSGVTGTGAFWNRTATVGIGGAWGGIDIGHQYSISFKTIGLYDPFNYKYTGIIPLAGIAAGNGAGTNLGGTRFNNDIQYTGTFGPITARAEYALGEVAGATGTNSAAAVGLSYANGPLAIGGAYTTKKVTTPNGIAGAAVAATPTNDDKAWTIGAAYTFGAFRVSGGYNDEKISGATPTGVASPTDTRQKVGWLGVGFDVTPALNLTAAYYQIKLDRAAQAAGAATAAAPFGTAALTGDGKSDLFIVGASYAFSKRTNAYADIDFRKLTGNQLVTGGATAAGQTQDRVTGVSVGINHLF
jgi:predicted porin